jgi:hypothetical protein
LLLRLTPFVCPHPTTLRIGGPNSFVALPARLRDCLPATMTVGIFALAGTQRISCKAYYAAVKAIPVTKRTVVFIAFATSLQCPP